MSYNATYTSSDASPIVIDFGAKIVVAAVSFASVIALVVLYRWMKKK